jgi:LmbE family N-acetylglucosaminyl deacetylase
MKPSAVLRASCCAVSLIALAQPAGAQTWRRAANDLGTTARVLIVGARPEDEDNALIAWLGLGRNVETAYLSITRGESSPNVAGTERQSALAVVRTAELLAERQRDRAHQYFTRAYDFGSTPLDSIVDVMWPHDSLLRDMVSIVRAYRPHIIIALNTSDTTEHDATRRLAARLAREAYEIAPDPVRMPFANAARLPAWTPLRLLTRVDAPPSGSTNVVTIDVGEFDRDAGRSYAELGADIRKLQRTQPAPLAPAVGLNNHFYRIEAARGDSSAASLFAGIDTSWARLSIGPANARASFDSLTSTIALLHAQSRTATGDSLAAAFARATKYSIDVRLALPCSDLAGVPSCAGTIGDAAIAMETVHRRAVQAFLEASGIVVDGTVARELVASGDSVPVTARVFNGSGLPLSVRKLTATSRSAWSPLTRDTSVVMPDSVATWTGNVRVIGAATHWWQANGLQSGTALHSSSAPRGSSLVPEMLTGEDRIPRSGIEATLAYGGVEVPLVQSPLVYRSPGAVRGDARHALAGVAPVSVLLEKTAEYERANLPIDRLFRVYLSTGHTKADTVSVELQLPPGLRADSVARQVVIPPLSARNVFFRIKGKMPVGPDSIHAVARRVVPLPPRSGTASNRPAVVMPFDTRPFNFGSIAREYPHIPTQQFIRTSAERVEAVDVRIPPRLHVAYVKGTDDVQTPLGQLQVNAQPLDPSLLSVVDLSYFTTVLIGADAMADDALVGAIPSLVDFMKKGGAVVIMPGGDEITRSGLLPYPILFDSALRRIRNPETPVRITDRSSQLLTWPNAITAKDFADWNVERARSVPIGFDSHYRTPLAVGDPTQSPNLGTLLSAPVGKGLIIYSALSLDRELIVITPGAARIFVNLLSAGLTPGSTKTP